MPSDSSDTPRLERPLPIDGQAARITELWAWTAIDPMTDTEGIVSARIGREHMPLVTSMERVARAMEPFAREAAVLAAEPRPVVQLRRFVPADS